MIPPTLIPTLTSCRFGIEKESLRATPDGQLSQRAHPRFLGSKLTHPMITTDYAETQLELITPPCATLGEVKDWLRDLHGYVASGLEQEWIWPSSMPCLLPDDEHIAIADYGTSHSGQMKMAYRRGLAHRYGKHMQTISGLHFNMSFGTEFWEGLAALRNTANTREFRDATYMGVVRNFVRHLWLVALLFGSSPAFAVNFLKNRQDCRPTVVGRVEDHTWLAPYATTLRMSEVGYKNASQQHLHASYDTLSEYLKDLEKATTTVDPRFEQFGVVRDGIYQQLNTNVIQIEAEYYGAIRPKNPVKRCERPITALRTRGIEYIEVRAIDIHPLEPTGIEDCGLYWLPTFVTWCLLSDSPPLSISERREANLNLLKMVHEGRAPDVQLFRREEKVKAKDWAVKVFAELDAISEQFADAFHDPAFKEAQKEQRRRLTDPRLLPSAQILATMKEFHNDHIATHLHLAQQHTEEMRKQGGGERREDLLALAKRSLEEQHALEVNKTISFEEYLKCYFS